MASLFPDICCDDLTAARDFYVTLLGMKVVFESDWYVQLQAPDDPGLQIAFVERTHASVPERFQQTPRGVIVTIERDDVDAVAARADEMGAPLHVPLRDEAWGQRHFMTEDPAGLLVDVVKLIPPSEEHAEGYVAD